MAYMRDNTGRRLDSFRAISRDEVLAQIAGSMVTKKSVQIFGSNGSGTAYTGTELLMRVPWTPTADVTRWRIGQHNLGPSGTGPAGTITTTGLNVGPPLYDATGAVNGVTTGALTSYLPGWSFDSAAGSYLSPWIDGAAKPFSKLTPVMLSIGMTSDVPLAFAGTSIGCYFRTAAGAAALSGSANPGLSGGSFGYTNFYIEYETVVPSTTPQILYVGDSLTEGRRSAGNPYPDLHARRSGGLAVINGHGGATTGNFDAPTDWQWTRYPWGSLTYDAAVVCLGSNNANSGNTLASFQTGIINTINTIRTVTGKANLPIYLGTVPPRGLTTNEALRVSYNNWLRSLPYGVQGCFDFDIATQNPADVTVLDPRWVGDGTHPDLAGYKRMADTLGGRLIA